MPRVRAFTLTEMMVVMALVGLLAVIAIPIYDGYIRQTKASEARSMIGAIVAAEKAYAERNGTFVEIPRNAYEEFLKKLRVDVRESALFDYQVCDVSGGSSFTVIARVNREGAKEGLSPGGCVIYEYRAAANPRGKWIEALDGCPR
jgi:prepilin-type N-terminal cleavage/methylation domain-containing protein